MTILLPWGTMILTDKVECLGGLPAPEGCGPQIRQDIGMVDPECVIQPVHAIVLLQQALVGNTQEADVLLINATIPDVIQDGHLLKL